MRWSTFCNFN